MALDGVGRRLRLRAAVLQPADEDVDLAVGVQREERVGTGEPGEVQLVGVVLRGVEQVAVGVQIGERLVEPRSVHASHCSGDAQSGCPRGTASGSESATAPEPRPRRRRETPIYYTPARDASVPLSIFFRPPHR
ncbi:hypothetical protein BN903_33 [Halorubrum sp. AJ67]|nr:hypothetical protein BN903_33 [Halorubrum sp. AJ67]